MAGSTDQAARAFYELSKRLKDADKGVRTQFHAAMKEAAKPLIPAVQKQARQVFPKAGRMNRFMSRASRYRAVTRTGATTAGVSIRANRTDPRVDEQGRIVHPVPVRGSGYTITKTSVKTRKTTTKREGTKFLVDDKGHRLMVVQYLPQAVGFFSETIKSGAGDVRADMIRRLEQWAIKNLSGQIRG